MTRIQLFAMPARRLRGATAMPRIRYLTKESRHDYGSR